MEVNITGLRDESQPDWEERAKELCKPERFFASVGVTKAVLDKLSDRENALLAPRLILVARFAEYMAAGMLKGVIKYASDITADDEHNSVESWISYFLGEGADFANYQILLLNAFEREQNVKGS